MCIYGTLYFFPKKGINTTQCNENITRTWKDSLQYTNNTIYKYMRKKHISPIDMFPLNEVLPWVQVWQHSRLCSHTNASLSNQLLFLLLHVWCDAHQYYMIHSHPQHFITVWPIITTCDHNAFSISFKRKV